MVKVRGQSYPAISLAKAILQTKLIYEQERNRALDEATIAKALDDCVTHTAFASTISALLKYGLLESVESLFKVSEDAENIILLSRGHPDRVRSLKDIAFKPYLFSKLRESFSARLPSDNNLRSSLVKMGFSPKTMENIIQSYLETLKFVQEEETFVLNDLKVEGQPLEKLDSTHSKKDIDSSHPTNVNNIHPSSPSSVGQSLLYRIAVDCTARIEFDGQVTQEGLEKLISLLELNADVFPKAERKL